MAATGIAILETIDGIAMFVNPWLLSDLAVSADLAMATVRCAIYNIRANLADVKTQPIAPASNPPSVISSPRRIAHPATGPHASGKDISRK